MIDYLVITWCHPNSNFVSFCETKLKKSICVRVGVTLVVLRSPLEILRLKSPGLSHW